MITYLDNAATTFPKPEPVLAEMNRFFLEAGGTPGRGAHQLARRAAAAVNQTRVDVAKLIHVDDPSRVIFTSGATASINMVLRGAIPAGKNVVISGLEHNAVDRTLSSLSRGNNIQIRRVEPGADGLVPPAGFEAVLDADTALIVLAHASNVTGAVQPVEAVARLAAARKIPLLLDCAQTAGCWPIDASVPGIAAVAFSGHKALFGPPGVGVLWLAPGFEPLPLIEGGTGTDAEADTASLPLPVRYEAGTPNTAGIAALGAGIRFVQERGVEAIAAHSKTLIDLFIREGGPVDGVAVVLPDLGQRVGILSFTMAGYPAADLAASLDSSFDIAVRAGLHCAPSAHRGLGTLPAGTVRISTSALTTEGEMSYLIEALHQLAMLA